ncbi:MAG: PKD-like domain-containing protein [Saprospiraceae bacterium]
MRLTGLHAAFFSLIFLFFLFNAPLAVAQCPRVEAVLIDACGTEQWNEFVIIHSGAGFNTDDLQFSFDLNNNIMGQPNNDINIDLNNDPADPTPCGLQPGNPAAYSGCSNITAIGPGFDVPANSIVVLQTSGNATANSYAFTSLCGAGQCVFVIASSCVRTAGGFSNAGSSPRTSVFQINGGCTQTIVYTPSLLPGGNGAYYLPLTNTYGNGGCSAPPSSPAPQSPNIDPISNVTACGAYTLPPITGQNLTPNAAYFTGTNRTGTQYDPGDVITATVTLFAHDFSAANCDDQETFTVTINPLPSVNQPNEVEVCAGQSVSVPFSGSPGAGFTWTNDNTAIGLGTSGSGNINFTSANVSTVQIATITVTPVQGPCTGDPVTFSITVNPRPMVNPPGNRTVCAGEPLDVAFSGPGNPTYNWTNSNTAIGLDASGSGDISFTAAFVGNPTTGTITVNATENGCTGPNQNFTITVNPLPVVNPPNDLTVCAGAPVNVPINGTAGATFNWQNDNPAVGLGPAGSGSISFTAANVSAQQVATISIVPRRNNCDGEPVVFTITVNPLPTLENPGDQTVCGGESVFIPLFGDNNPGFDWTNSNPAIGLPAFGNGDLAFTAANVAANTTGTIVVTPILGACIGPVASFTITVTPAPTVNQPANVQVCGGAPVSVSFGGTPGADFNWTNSNPAIGLPAVGTGNIAFTAGNPATVQTATITVTPVLGNCTGATRVFTLTINPRPVSAMPDQIVCSGDSARIFLTGVPQSAVWNWINSDTTLGLGPSGTDSLIFRAMQVATPDTGLVVVSPQLGACAGAPDTFRLIIAPLPVVDNPGDQTFCAGDSAFVAFNGSPGASLQWTNSDTAIGLPAAGSGNLRFLAAGDSALIRVAPVVGACAGDTTEFKILMIQPPTVNLPAPLEACDGALVEVAFSGSPGATFTWVNSNPNIGLPGAGSGDLSFTALAPDTVETALITITPVSGGCTGPALSFSVTVRPRPAINPVSDLATCGGESVQVVWSGTPGAVFNWTNNNPNIGLPAAGSGNIDFLATNLPDVATLVVTPVLAGCIGNSDTLEIQIVSAPVMNPVADTALCPGEAVAILFSGTPGAQYSWTNSNPAIGLPASGFGPVQFTVSGAGAPQTAAIAVTPELGACTGATTVFNLLVHPAVQAQITGPAILCAGDTTLLTASGGANYLWNTGANTAGIAVAPDTATLYAVTVRSAEGCADADSFLLAVLQPDRQTVFQGSCNPADTGVVVATFSNQFGCDSIITTITNLLPTDTTARADFTCDPAQAGVFFQILSNQFGCDSVLAITRNLVPADTTLLSRTSCDPGAAGVFTQLLTNQFGCDSLIVTTVIFDPLDIDTTLLSASSCDPAQTGVFTSVFTNQFGCDSVVIRTVTLTPADTVAVSGATCNPAQAGVFTSVLSNQFGCDSVVIRTITLLPRDTLAVGGATCDPAQAGVFTSVLSNQFGCDSVVIRTIALLPRDTVAVSSATCDPAQAGVFTSVLSNQFGCDSVVIRTITLLPRDTVTVGGATCDPAQAGVFTSVLSNQFGCDSIVIRNIALLPADTVTINGVTCDPASVGTFTTVLTNQQGCDSVVITQVLLFPSDTTLFTGVTCKPAQAGVFTQRYFNSFGCDSVVITTISLLPSDTVAISGTTCDPAQAGVFVQAFTNSSGCDSLIITTISFDPALCALNVSAQPTPANCAGRATGSIRLSALNGQPPYQYVWASGGGSGNGQIPAAGVPALVSGLPAGNYSVTVTDASGLLDTVLSVQILQPPALSLTVAAPTPYGGFAVRCFDSADGSAQAQATGGVPGYQFVWSSGVSGSQASGLVAGAYQVTVTDQNGCTAAASASLAAPPPLRLALSLGLTDCGDTQAELTAAASGGAGAFEIRVDGSLISGFTAALDAGLHNIELRDANDCLVDTTLAVVLPPVPQLRLPADTIIQAGADFVLLAQTNLTAWDTLIWSPLPDPACPNCLQQAWRPQATAVYIATIVDTFGCRASDTLLVSVDKTRFLYIPNAFSPNDDGFNDFFQLGAGPGIGDLEILRIYDRWGGLLYELDAPVPAGQWPGWDGMSRGEKIEPGVYIYYLRVQTADGDIIEKSGDVTILR